MAKAMDFLTPTDLNIDRFTKDCFRLIFQLENTSLPTLFHEAPLDRGSVIVCSKWNKFNRRLVTGRRKFSSKVMSNG